MATEVKKKMFIFYLREVRAPILRHKNAELNEMKAKRHDVD